MAQPSATISFGDSNHGFQAGIINGDVHHHTPLDRHNECLRDLIVTDPREDKARIEQDKDRLNRDCYAWILEDASFQHWRRQDDSRLLWIKGDPGKGKTMMAMGLIAELSQKDSAEPSLKKMSRVMAKLKKRSSKPSPTPGLLAYFFCQSIRPELNSAVSVLRGLIYLLIVQKEDLMRHVQKRYKDVGKQLFEGHNAIHTLREILSDMLSDTSLQTTYLIVDALDECMFGRSNLLHIITDDIPAQRSRVKWIVTSRNLPDIERYLRPDSVGVKVSLEVSASYVSKAVASFIESKVQHMAVAQKYDPKTRAEVQQLLYDKAEGTFLWVALACKELESVPLFRARKVLQELPSGLDPLYNRMIGQILAQKDTQTVQFCIDILRSISLSYRPLQLKELIITANLPQDQLRNIQEVIDLISYCGSFLTIRKETVFFIHLSAKDYFTLGKGQQIFNGALVEEQGRITCRLLDAMYNTLQRDMCSLQRPGALIQDAVGRLEDSTFQQIIYACEYWVDHLHTCAQHCDNILLDDGKVHRFLRKHLLHWLEAMSLMKKIPEAVAALQKLQFLVNGPKSTALLEMVQDALHFMRWGRLQIQKAPLQVYYSALVFAPERSIIRRQFTQEMPEWMEVRSKIDEDWGFLLRTFEGYSSKVNSAAFSPQGDRVASASNDQTVQLWDTNTGQLLQTLEGHTGWVSSVAFSPQGERVASASHDQTVRLWNANTGQLLQTLEGHTGWVNSVAFSPQGDRVASASNDETLRLWDANTGQPLQTFEGHTSYVMSVAFSPQGDRMVSASKDLTVQLWDAHTGQLLQTLEGHIDWVYSVAFSPQGDRVASASKDRTVQLWDVNKGQLLRTLDCCTGWVYSVAFSPQGERVASASHDYMVRLWDANTGQLLHTLEGHTDLVNSVAFSPRGDRVVSASDDQTVQLWDASTERPLQTLKHHTNSVKSVDFSPQGDQVASASNDQTVRLWNANTGQLLQTLEGHTGWVNSVAFSPQGDRVASASRDQTVKLWDVSTGRLLQTLEGHARSVRSVAFSPQGDQVVSTSWDRTVQLWDANTGRPLRTLKRSPYWARTNSNVADAFPVFSLKGQWVTYKTEDILLLPFQYEITCSAICGNTIALGIGSGRVIVLTCK